MNKNAFLSPTTGRSKGNNAIRQRQQLWSMMQMTKKNSKCMDHDYVIGDKVLVINEGEEHEARGIMLGFSFLYKCLQWVQ